ncbi:hypothetical protein Patl1_29564 [Pistacia atlantica]|uniref:Uncharacterized protein n=1 Tax=Pistacia atlantica TaxID=434234 RepID=A0ACC1ADW4_9ROSI|nr:hypothetical protein Patl1_29564 [Pistacia atlantica]
MVSEDQQLHVMFLPYVAPGHMMPMVDMARLFAANGIRVTILTTTKNALSFQNSIARDVRFGQKISLEILRFPSVEAGLPEGCENLYDATSPEMHKRFFRALELLRPEFEHHFRRNHPDCIVSDNLYTWTVKLANELGIPRLAFSGSGFFNLCVSHNIDRYKPHDDIKLETEIFIVPGLPDKVKLTRSQLPDIVKTKNEFSSLFEELKKAERDSFGVLVNSFYDLEAGYVDHFRKDIGIRAWSMGPVSMFNRDTDDKIERGGNSCVSKHSCLSWLGSREANSVLFICFGSLTRFTKAQIREIACALEESGHSFIWVVGKVSDSKDCDFWLPERFQENVSGKGLIISGWAPQILILEHPAIGGFLTHCGWNSIVEGVSAGVPMVTWPVFAEQFYNEKLVTQVIKFGVPEKKWKDPSRISIPP